jgi:OFA family oxalate/formate antiporter-like MFS transporter
MSDQTKAANPPAVDGNRGWIVTFAGTGINLALGVLYAWSVVSKQITREWGWNETQAALPYSVAIIVFAVMMVPAGRMQDKTWSPAGGHLGGISAESALSSPAWGSP